MDTPPPLDRPPLDRPLVLIGLMGAGKSTVGRRLAARLGLPFVDSDAEIEIACGCTIPEIWARYGEPAFRDGERRVVRRLLADPAPRVIATGGGVFADADSRALLLERALVIWLRADVPVLAERVERRPTRPLVANGRAAEVLAELAAAREPLYAEAHLEVRTDGRPHGRAVDAILDAVRGWTGR